MKVYSTCYIGSLLSEARMTLVREGFASTDLPHWEVHKYAHTPDRIMTYGPQRAFAADQHTSEGYWSGDFTLSTYGDELHSPFRSQHKANRDDSLVYAATFDQWGIMLAALFDVARDNHEQIRLGGGGPYDNTSKRAPRNAHGEQYLTSKHLFDHKTLGQYGRGYRRAGAVDLSCLVHKWESTAVDGLVRCGKTGCTRNYRFFG